MIAAIYWTVAQASQPNVAYLFDAEVDARKFYEENGGVLSLHDRGTVTVLAKTVELERRR